MLKSVTGEAKTKTPRSPARRSGLVYGGMRPSLRQTEMAVASGKQAALMAPTEILAEQHHRSIGAMLRGADVRIALEETLAGEPDAEAPVAAETTSRKERGLWVAALVLVAALTGLAMWSLRPAPP